MPGNKSKEHNNDETASLETTQIIIVAKTGKLTETDIVTNTVTSIEELKDILSTACDNKKSTTFSCYHTWRFRNRNNRFGLSEEEHETKYIYIDLWAKTDGHAGQENKYELPPPVDEIIFFGNMALVARLNKEVACNLSAKKWKLVYEKLFGGFEDLATTAQADENEVDELALIPDSKKTKNGYLKDGFVVDDDETSSGSSGVIKSKSKTTSKANTKNKTTNTKCKFVGDDSSNESEFVTETETEETSIDTGTGTGTETGTGTGTETETEIDSECNTPHGKNKNINININIKMPSNKPNNKPNNKSNNKPTNGKTKVTKNKKIIDDEEDNDDELVEDSYETTN